MDLDLPPDKMWNPEDAFYNDPVETTVIFGDSDGIVNQRNVKHIYASSVRHTSKEPPIEAPHLAPHLSYSPTMGMFGYGGTQLDQNANTTLASNGPQPAVKPRKEYTYKELYDETAIDNAPTCYMS